MRGFSLLLLVAAVTAHEKLPGVSLKRDPNTRLVLWGTRHGNRNPESFHMGAPNVWGYEGPVELTSFGKRQGYGLGRELRRFVGQWVNVNFLPKEAKFFSSSANRCQMTLQSALAGFYTPQGWADWDKTRFDDWSPVPYSINDPLLRMYAVEKCPNSDAAWKPISDDTLDDLVELTERKKDLINYVANSTGWKPAISSVADMADNLIEIDLYHSQYPAWIERPSLKGYNKHKIIHEIMEFAENHQIRCAEYEPCRNLMAGVWLKHVVDAVKTAQKDEGPKVIGYASHTEVTLALMKLMGVDKKEITTSAGFVIEFRNKPADEIRILNHDPNPIDHHVIYKAKYSREMARLASLEGWIPVEKFEKAVEKFFIDDWKQACGQPSCGTN